MRIAYAVAVAATAVGVGFGPAPAAANDALEGGYNYLLFSGSDIWQHGASAYSGLRWSPDAIDRDGFTLKLVSSGGAYRYRSGALGNLTVTGFHFGASILPGWRFTKNNLIVTMFVGFDVQDHRVLPYDPSASLRGLYWGVRGGIELWYQPTPQTMLTADASVSTIGAGYSARVAAGWRVLDAVFVGPEIGGFSSNGDYRQMRAGLHVTALRAGDSEWAGAIGWALDNDDRSGFYGRIGLITRR